MGAISLKTQVVRPIRLLEMKAWAPFCFIMLQEIYFTINYSLNYYVQLAFMKLLSSQWRYDCRTKAGAINSKQPCTNSTTTGIKMAPSTSARLCSTNLQIYIFIVRFYPRDAMLARVIAIATCQSVRLSVTRRYCVKTQKAIGMIFSPSGSPKTLVF